MACKHNIPDITWQFCSPNKGILEWASFSEQEQELCNLDVS